MLENLLVATFVGIATLYVFRSLAPAQWLSARTGGAANRLRAAGYPVWANLVEAYAPASGGCGGCGSCGTDAAKSAAASTGPDASAASRVAVDPPVEKPLMFVRKTRR